MVSQTETGQNCPVTTRYTYDYTGKRIALVGSRAAKTYAWDGSCGLETRNGSVSRTIDDGAAIDAIIAQKAM